MTSTLHEKRTGRRASTQDGPPTIELRSDTFTMPTPAMLEAAVHARLGDDVYGEDPTVAELERLGADLLGKPAACLMPSGTMANLTALLTHCPRGTKAVVGRDSDIYLYEAGGASVCGGIMYEALPNRADGSIDPALIAAVCDVDPTDAQFALPSVVCLETPQNKCGGIPLTLGYLAEVAEIARTRGIAVHLDGARIFNAALALDVTVLEIAAFADTVQVCLSKGLSAPVGSLLAGQPDVIEEARRQRKMLGGGMRQAGVIAACGLLALTEMVRRLPEDHANARRLARGLARLPGLLLDTTFPPTNMVFFTVTDPRYTTREFIGRAARAGVRMEELGTGRIRAATHAGISATDVDRATRVIGEILQ